VADLAHASVELRAVALRFGVPEMPAPGEAHGEHGHRDHDGQRREELTGHGASDRA